MNSSWKTAYGERELLHSLEKPLAAYLIRKRSTRRVVVIPTRFGNRLPIITRAAERPSSVPRAAVCNDLFEQLDVDSRIQTDKATRSTGQDIFAT